MDYVKHLVSSIGEKLAHKKNVPQNDDDNRSESPTLAHAEDTQEEEQNDITPNISISQDEKPAGLPPDFTPLDASSSLDVSGRDAEVEEDINVEMPPPMEEIHTVSLPTTVASQEDLSNRIPSALSLNSDAESRNSVNTVTEMENLLKQKMMPLKETDSELVEEHEIGADQSYSSIKTEDSEAEPSIDQISLVMSTSDINLDTTEGLEIDPSLSELTPEELNCKNNLHRRSFVIAELIKTEKDYVNDLGMIIDGYIPAVKEATLPEGMEGKDKIVFGNIQQIYEWHLETFSNEIAMCKDNPERVGNIFIRYERRLHMYVKYCENKPKSDYVVAEYSEFFEELRQRLGHRLQLPDVLIKPVQRITKYQLLLKDILKYTEKAGCDTKVLQRAVEVMHVVPNAANDMMNVGRLQGFNGKITAQGKLLLQDGLQVMEMSSKVKTVDQKFRDRRVFLFEQTVIMSEETEKKKNSLSAPGYIFKNSVPVNNMSLDERPYEKNPLTFTLVNKTPGSDLKLILLAPTLEVKQNWVSKVRSILDMQGDFLRALQSPIEYQNMLTKELSAPDIGSSVQGKNSQLRKTHSQPPQSKSCVCSLTSDQKAEVHRHGHRKSDPSSERYAVDPDKKNTNELTFDKSKLDNKKTPPCSSGSPKPKKNFLEGFKNTLRPKNKGQDNNILSNNRCNVSNLDASQKRAVDNIVNSDNSSTNHDIDSDDKSHKGSCGTSHEDLSTSSTFPGGHSSHLDNGTLVKVAIEYTAIREDEITVSKGEIVQILSSNRHHMYLVFREANDISPAAEGWIPATYLQLKESDIRKSWHSAFKIRKPSWGKDKVDIFTKTSSLDRSRMGSLDRIKGKRNTVPDISMEAPVIVSPLIDVTVNEGSLLALSCQVCGRPRPVIIWRNPKNEILMNSPNVVISFSENGLATLEVYNIRSEQGGEYSCMISNEIGTVSSMSRVTVIPSKTDSLKSFKEKTTMDEVMQAMCTSSYNTFPDDLPTYTYDDNGNETDEASSSSVSWSTSFDTDCSIISEISRGRFAVVYKCSHKANNNVFVAKMMNKKICDRISAEQEYKLLKTVNHEQIVKAIELYETPLSFIISMDWIDNQQLLDNLSKRTDYDEVQAAAVAHQILEIIQHIHSYQIVHLDIKPENFLVDLSQQTTMIKLIDFGDAQYLRNSFHKHTAIGNPEFMAPEIISGESISLLTDIWSVGIIVYVMLSGVSPFLDETIEETCTNIILLDYCFPDEYFSNVTQEAKDFITMLLEKSPSKRPSAMSCMQHPWINQGMSSSLYGSFTVLDISSRLNDFIERRRPQKDRQIIPLVRTKLK